MKKCPYPLTPCYLRTSKDKCTADSADTDCSMQEQIKEDLNQKLMDEVENLITESARKLQPTPEQQEQYLKSIQFRFKKQQTLDQFKIQEKES